MSFFFPPSSGFPSCSHTVQFDRQSHVNSKHLIYFAVLNQAKRSNRRVAPKNSRPAGLPTQTAPTRAHGHHPPLASSPAAQASCSWGVRQASPLVITLPRPPPPLLPEPPAPGGVRLASPLVITLPRPPPLLPSLLLLGCGRHHHWESSSPQVRLPCCLFLTTFCGSQPADFVLFPLWYLKEISQTIGGRF